MACFELCFTCTDAKSRHLEFSQLTGLNNRKLVWYFKSLWYAVVSNMTHFYILFGMREKMPFLEQCVSPVLTQNQDIWNFYGSLTLNNGKLI